MMFGLDRQLQVWLEEDIGSGDITTEAIVAAGAMTKAVIHAKSPGILAGGEAARRVFELLDESVAFRECLTDGAVLTASSVIAEVEGNARAILTGERLALNLLQHLSGIATRTAALAAIAAPYGASVADTRKTTPGLRRLEKYAVRVGGGRNHRLGLYDAMLIKDNHIKVAGGVREAVERARRYASHMTKIEVEVETLAEVKAALAAGADVIMLDNMIPEEMAAAVKLIQHRAIVEASGGIDEQTLAAAAAAGVDIISVGALTHSVKALDISMDIGAIK
ncbi:MAG: carboxylating nicotinate-nucleotide diphosphorylase [Selenomonas sp.]|nr:carboxylating nicotinate-nucleotide diphosphorylase [Selenomonas sp.]